MKKLITEADILNVIKNGGSSVLITNNHLVTPAARDKIREYKLNIINKEPKRENETSGNSINRPPKNISIGSDHTGFKAKKMLKEYLSGKGFNVSDAGTNSEESCDYPDFAVAVVKEVIQKKADTGIILDATGIPSAITANKFPGVRAATCYNEFSAHSAREHNNANIIVMGAKTLGDETIKSVLDKFLETPFAGGRHQRRLNKITDIELKLLNKSK